MRPFHTFLATILVSFCLAAVLPAQTVQTIPVGFNTATLPTGTVAAPSNTVVSAPFYQIATFQGAVSSVDSPNQISFSGTTFTSTLTAPPYLARFKTGNSTGRFYVVTSFTNTQLTLDISTTDSTPDIAGYPMTTGAPTATQTQVAVGDSVEILPANTLGTLFPNGGSFLANSDVTQADNIYLWNGTGWDVYFYDAGVAHWRKSPGLASVNQNSKVILPDRGMFIKRRGASLNLTFLGTVPSTSEKTDIPGPKSTFVANRFPVDMTLGGAGATALNLQNLPGWASNSDVTQADNVYLWNGTGWDVYFYDTGVAHWRKSPGIASFNANSVPVPLGGAMFIVRRSTATGSGSTSTQGLPYTL